MKKAKDAEAILHAPLPMRDGVAPSRVYLPKGPWPTVLEFLVQRFKFMAPDVLHGRLERGEIVDEAGTPLRPDSSYQPLCWLWYYREVPDEVVVPFDLTILHHDDRLVAVDKPHFLASIPSGRYLQETALIRLRNTLDLPLLSPIHRLDKDTAGVMLFCVNPANRGAYQTLFQTRHVKKEYEAVAPWSAQLILPFVHRSQIQPKASFFTMHEVVGQPNSETRIELIRRQGSMALYRLQPLTGRKHQLRVHMGALGIPIKNDLFYPELKPHQKEDDFSKPLQLLARAVEFKDPFSDRQCRFESRRSLMELVEDSAANPLLE